MDPQDHLRALLDGVGCTVCEASVPPDRIQLLARRDDLVFVEIECPACASTTLGFIVARGLPPEAARFASAPPISGDDVLDMHELLKGWHGDLGGLLRRSAHPVRAGGSGARR